MGVKAIIAFGGNIGDVKKTLISARRMLADSDSISLLACSRLYQSPPMGPKNQADYFNAVIAIETTLSALLLLHLMQEIEARHGRTRNRRWGERSLDLDLIAYDDMHMQSAELTLPHPGMTERMFVLQPLCDIRPEWRHPAGLTALQLLQHLQASGTELLKQGEMW
ncbi:MAG: 2-amino-4-hydroxy-6-hydroxymethyldihydropteridine diphosphokinase [Mariprofundaceae bacterium]|nr:2-amino-4-hydroxy-6-hydroxymethyldihydropteridine diphosphokinase [Mariprofundaceae bacterium]